MTQFTKHFYVGLFTSQIRSLTYWNNMMKFKLFATTATIATIV